MTKLVKVRSLINGLYEANFAFERLSDIEERNLSGNALLRELGKWSMDTSSEVYASLKNDSDALEIACQEIKGYSGINILGTVQEQLNVEGLARKIKDINFYEQIRLDREYLDEIRDIEEEETSYDFIMDTRKWTLTEEYKNRLESRRRKYKNGKSVRR